MSSFGRFHNYSNKLFSGRPILRIGTFLFVFVLVVLILWLRHLPCFRHSDKSD